MRTPRKWLRSVKRRRAGIYLVRTDRHFAPSRRENGYVGRSDNVKRRREDHLGVGQWGAAAKPWSDLNPVWHVLRLPWWLSWRWVQSPLELAAILLLLPRYNGTWNHRNPRRVLPSTQRNQRAARDSRPWEYRIAVKANRRLRQLSQVAGLALVIVGITMSIRTSLGK